MLNKRSMINYSVFFLSFLICFISIISIDQSYAQANLVEETNRYKIFSGNFFDLTIPKHSAPKAEFSISDFGEVDFKVNKIAEYQSASSFMNSLNDLEGKSYKLDYLEWDSIGYTSSEKISVEFSKDYLDMNSSIHTTLSVYNFDKTLDNYQIKALEEVLFQVNISNWQFSGNSRGLAINLISSFLSQNEYARLGPYNDFDSGFYKVKLITHTNEFEIRFKPNILIKTTSGSFEEYETMFFANYNIGAYEAKAADFWISVPFRYGIKQIIFRFVCSYTINEPSNANISSIFFVSSFLVLVFSIKYFRTKNRGNRL